MARFKTRAKKNRLVRAGRQTKWAPFWIIPKSFTGIKRIHPSQFTRIRRRWRKSRIEP